MSLSYPQRMYRSGDAESLHRYTLIPDHPDFTRARLNALHLSDVSEPAVHEGVPISVKLPVPKLDFIVLKKKKKSLRKEDLEQKEYWIESGTNCRCDFESLSLLGLSFLSYQMGIELG